ncbi:MAG: tetratricopeptide repeat protein [Bryobacteraceae bacterium]
MKLARTLAILAAAAGALAAQAPPQQQKQQRDLKYENSTPPARAPAPAAVTIPRSYALVIGIANYKNLSAKDQLQFSERDAESMYSILISPEGGNFHAENVHKLVGPRATLANMRHELEDWLPTTAQADDRVLIYFAGHGFLYNGRAYLAPYDLDAHNIAGTGYPMDTLGSVIGSRIQAKWKVLITDACHSGAITPEADRAAVSRSLLDLNSSLFSLTASRDRERSFESADWGGGHGIFTYYVVKGLEGAADESHDGIVTADELADYVRSNVREATNGQQNPTSERGSFDPNMLLAYLPSGATPGTPPPPKDGTLIFETNMDGVEVFVDGKSAGVVNKGTPLRLPGLQPGVHTVRGVHMGYEPDGPREQIVYPGQESTVTLKILIVRNRPHAAVEQFDKGLDFYNKGTPENYRKAVVCLQAALAADPNYSQAALYLGRVYRDLFQEDEAEKYLRRAIEIDPDYLEARATLGGMLLDKGALDESIVQLNTVVQRDQHDALAWYLLAEALRMKELYPDSIDAARKAIRLTPNNAEAQFWLAESLRLSGKYQESLDSYQQYLKLSNFDSRLAGKMNYYVLGYLVGFGRKKRAAQRDVWQDLRSLAYFGLCDSERMLNQFDTAIAYCQKALTYDPSDPFAHFGLALSYTSKAQATGAVEPLIPARKHFAETIALDPYMPESERAKKYIAKIDSLMASASK